jgi:hypothetical protein
MNFSRKKQSVVFLVLASLLFLAFFPVHVGASALTLAWDSNTENDLAGYKVYCGTQSRDYIHVLDVGNITYCTVTGLEPETRYYFALTAYDTSRNESDYSWEVSAVTGDDPDPAPAPSASVPLIDDHDGGCFIATAAYGSYLNPHVKILRDFRDVFLGSNSLGRKCVHLYYQYAPPIASQIEKHGRLKFIIRQGLLPLIAMSSLSLKTTSSPTFLLLSFCILLISTMGLSTYRRKVR